MSHGHYCSLSPMGEDGMYVQCFFQSVVVVGERE